MRIDLSEMELYFPQMRFIGDNGKKSVHFFFAFKQILCTSYILNLIIVVFFLYLLLSHILCILIWCGQEITYRKYIAIYLLLIIFFIILEVFATIFMLIQFRLFKRLLIIMFVSYEFFCVLYIILTLLIFVSLLFAVIRVIQYFQCTLYIYIYIY